MSRMENINLIRKVAWSFHKSTGLEWDDLFQEAALAYLKALETYNPKRGKISTYVWSCMTNEVTNYIKRELQINPPSEDLEEALNVYTSSEEVWEKLPDKAMEAAELLFNAPEKFVGLDPLGARLRLRSLLFEEGWKLKDVRIAMRDLKSAFS